MTGDDRFAAPRPDQIIGTGARSQNAPAVAALIDGLTRGQSILATQDPQPIRPAPGPPGMLFCQSSGSGGRVKTIRRSQASWIASFRVNRHAFAITPRDRYATLGHLGHSLSLYAAIEALHLGAGLMVLAGDSPRTQMRALTRATVLYATPAQLHRLALAGGTLPDLRHILCGGGRLDEATRDAARALCPQAQLRVFYGASETSFIALADADTPPGSVGRAYPGVQIRSDPDGAIWVASPYLAQGYAEPDLAPPNRDGAYMATGDLGTLDPHGNLILHGRQSRRITTLDRTLSLEDVEAVLAAHGAPLSVALALPDPRRGMAVLAVVQGPPDDALAARLRRACRETLGDHAAPRRIVFVASLPMLASDKPDLAALARLCVAP